MAIANGGTNIDFDANTLSYSFSTAYNELTFTTATNESFVSVGSLFSDLLMLRRSTL